MKYKNRIKEIDLLQEEINQHRPLKKHILKQLRDYFRINLTYTSNALEYNTLNEIETKIILEDGITINGKPIIHHLEVLGHSEAYEYLFQISGADTILEKDIKNLHKLFYYRIDNKNAGHYRKVKVFIKDALHSPPSPDKIKHLMTEFMNKIPQYKLNLHPVEYAARLHAELVTIHPFIDGNGRTARLILNLALLQSGYTIVVIPPVVRNDYIEAVAKTNNGDYSDFNHFISQMLYETQKDYLRILQSLE